MKICELSRLQFVTFWLIEEIIIVIINIIIINIFLILLLLLLLLFLLLLLLLLLLMLLLSLQWRSHHCCGQATNWLYQFPSYHNFPNINETNKKWEKNLCLIDITEK